MLFGKPFELLLISVMLVLVGTLGLADVLFISSLPASVALPLILFYVFMHPLTAFFLWSGRIWALRAARIFVVVSLSASLFYFGRMNNVILVVNALLYLYSLLCLFRYDVKRVFDED